MISSRRAISPAVGVTLMVVLTILLASTFASGILTLGDDLSEKKDQIDAVATATGNPLSGESGDLIRVADATAGATDVLYQINFTIEPGSDTIGNSLNSVELEVTTGSPDMFSGTEQADLDEVGIDENSDGTIDKDISGDVDDWQVSNGGSALKIGFTGAAYSASADDSIIIRYDGVDNPTAAGTYDIRVQTSGDGNWHQGTIRII